MRSGQPSYIIRKCHVDVVEKSCVAFSPLSLNLVKKTILLAADDKPNNHCRNAKAQSATDSA